MLGIRVTDGIEYPLSDPFVVKLVGSALVTYAERAIIVDVSPPAVALVATSVLVSLNRWGGSGECLHIWSGEHYFPHGMNFRPCGIQKVLLSEP